MKTRYMTKFDEINSIVQTAWRKGDIEDEILDLLVEAYMIGIGMACEDFKREPDYDAYVMYEIIFKDIDGETVTDRIHRWVEDDDLPAMERLAESEFHRVANEASQRKAAQIDPTATKTWETMEDDRVRDTHEYLQSMTVGVKDYFVTWTGAKALYPGGFESAEENCNCRCYLTYRQGSLKSQTETTDQTEM